MKPRALYIDESYSESMFIGNICIEKERKEKNKIKLYNLYYRNEIPKSPLQWIKNSKTQSLYCTNYKWWKSTWGEVFYIKRTVVKY